MPRDNPLPSLPHIPKVSKMDRDFEPKDSAEAAAKREALGKHLQEKREQVRAEEKVAVYLGRENNLCSL